MDLWTEQQVVARLGEATRGKTLIVVTHRPAPLELVDRLIVLDGGVKVADGPREDVMRALRQAAARRGGTVAQNNPAVPTAPVTPPAVTIPLSTVLKGASR